MTTAIPLVMGLKSAQAPGCFLETTSVSNAIGPSSFTYNAQPVDVKQVGRELGVRYVLEGAVRKANGPVRIIAQATPGHVRSKQTPVGAQPDDNTAIATRPMMIGSLRELIGENPPAISLSVTQPAPMLPTTPQAWVEPVTAPLYAIPAQLLASPETRQMSESYSKMVQYRVPSFLIE
jgi:hypothetical protein